VTAVTSTSDAGPQHIRYRAAIVASIAAIAIGVFAGSASALITVVAPVMIGIAIGLAFLGVIVNAITRMADSGLTWGPVLTFIIATSDLTLLGLSSFFWAIVTGVAVSALIDKHQAADTTS
jgi:benzoate membrane transport protein